MQFGNLVRDTTIHSLICISILESEDDEISDVMYLEIADDLEQYLIDENKFDRLANLIVSEIFCPGDGYLHIDLVR